MILFLVGPLAWLLAGQLHHHAPVSPSRVLELAKAFPASATTATATPAGAAQATPASAPAPPAGGTPVLAAVPPAAPPAPKPVPPAAPPAPKPVPPAAPPAPKPLPPPVPFSYTIASWYGGRPEACYDGGRRSPLPAGITMWAASRTLHCGTTVEISGPAGTTRMLIEDHGPWLLPGRDLDLSPQAFTTVAGALSTGLVTVHYRVVTS